LKQSDPAGKIPVINSLQSKIIFLVIAIMAVTAVLIISISGREINQAMLTQQERLSQHVLSLINLNIRGEYNNLITEKIDSVSRYKQVLTARTDLVLEMIKQQDRYSRENRFSPETARQVVLDWATQAFGQETHGTIFIADENLTVLAYPDTDLIGRNIGGFTDMKNKTLAQNLAAGGTDPHPIVSVVNWPDRETSQARYLTCIQVYEPWNWVVGTVVNIEAIEVEAQEKLSKIVETLGETFAGIRIARTGVAFLFDNAFSVLAMTDPELSTEFQKTVNAQTGNLLVQDMVTKAIQGGGLMTYQSDLFHNQEMIAYVSYFKPLGWYIGVTVPVSEIREPAKAIVFKQSALIGVILLCSVLSAAWMVSRISRPLTFLAERVKAFSSTDLTRDETEDQYLDQLAAKYKDEVGGLANAFVFMKGQLKENIRQLLETTARNERIQGELNIAKDIQLGLLPKIFPPFPDCSAMDIYASLEPAKEVGGDLYDFYFVEDHKLCFTIGDVSGKGVPAALMMAITKTLIKTSAFKKIGPGAIMTEVNDAISSDNPQSMFVTLFVGILDLNTGVVTYANGGHNPAVHIAGSGQAGYQKGISGPVVGIMDGIQYKDLSLTLAPGDSLFLYTDGVTEAMDGQERFYSEATLLAQIESRKSPSPRDLVEYLKSDIKSFAAGAPQYDDIAMLMVRYKGV
jgi:sigma-B regulation protein RsbU (phosphoserine phosphatase)